MKNKLCVTLYLRSRETKSSSENGVNALADLSYPAKEI